MINKTFVFLDDTSTTTTSNPLIIANNNMLTIQVEASSTPDVTVYGLTDVEAVGQHMAVIDCATLKVVETITSAGNYFLPVTGISQVYVENNGTAGSVKIYGKLAG